MTLPLGMSQGSQVLLGIKKGKLAAPPTTIYLRLGERCSSNCSFCAQARSVTQSNKISRVNWPDIGVEAAIEAMKAQSDFYQRICIQTLSYHGMFDDLKFLLNKLAPLGRTISASLPPMQKGELAELKAVGLERVGIAMDGATPDIFNKVKGKDAGNVFSWERHLSGLEDAVVEFGNGVSTHLIIGLGETDEDVARFIQLMHDMGVLTGLFSFTPLKWIVLDSPQPDLGRYRALQAVRYLITTGRMKAEEMKFIEEKLVSGSDLLVDVGREAFQTSGCPGCNRPFYNERVLGPLYNYPRKLTDEEFEAAKVEARRYTNE
jgi:biotin synthase